MSKLKELINLIKDDDQIKRFKELEKVIDHNRSIQSDFNTLLSLQKSMVNKEYKKDKTYPEAKEKYEKQLEIVMKYPIVEEYLDLLEVINSDMALIKNIIEQEIAKDFD